MVDDTAVYQWHPRKPWQARSKTGETARASIEVKRKTVEAALKTVEVALKTPEVER